jgi:hypothetical protein
VSAIFSRRAALAALAGSVVIKKLGTAQMASSPVLPGKLPLWPGKEGVLKRFPGQYVFRESSGQIVIFLPDRNEPTKETIIRFWLQDRVEPTITANLKVGQENAYVYGYSVANGITSKASIWKWSLVAPPSRENLVSHSIWQAVNAYQATGAPQALLNADGPGCYLGWMDAMAKRPIEPGRDLSGFEIFSKFRPGLTTAYLAGREDPITVPEDIPGSVEAQIAFLQRPYIMEKAKVTVGPRFPPDKSAAEVATSFLADIRDLATHQLLDLGSPFVLRLQAELTRLESASREPSLLNVGAPSTHVEKDILAAAELCFGPRR